MQDLHGQPKDREHASQIIRVVEGHIQDCYCVYLLNKGVEPEIPYRAGGLEVNGDVSPLAVREEHLWGWLESWME